MYFMNLRNDVVDEWWNVTNDKENTFLKILILFFTFRYKKN